MTRVLPRSAARRAGIVPALAAAAAVALSGCQSTSPIATNIHYDPADGVSAQTGDVAVRDLVVLGTEKDGAGRLSGTLVNDGAKDAKVVITSQVASDPLAQVVVPAHRSVVLAEEEVAINKTPAPGAVMPLSIRADKANAVFRNVPVLLPDHAYSDMAPEGYTTQPREDRASDGATEGAHH